MDPETTKARHNAIFRALAHPVRQAVIDFLFERPGSSVGAVAAQFDSSRIAVMKHVRVLEDARLVLSQKQGRTRKLYFNPVPLHEVSEHWRKRYSSAWSTSLLDLKHRIEGRTSNDSLDHSPPEPSNRPRAADSSDSPTEEPS